MVREGLCIFLIHNNRMSSLLLPLAHNLHNIKQSFAPHVAVHPRHVQNCIFSEF